MAYFSNFSYFRISTSKLGIIKKNRYSEEKESEGDGRQDIILKPYDERNFAVIIELKKADNFLEMDAKCDVALEQIEDKNYAEGLLAEGYQSILKYGISFCKKSCRVKTSAAEHQI